jgi:hypothetical protein
MTTKSALVVLAVFLAAVVSVWTSAGPSNGEKIAFSQTHRGLGSGGGNLFRFGRVCGERRDLNRASRQSLLRARVEDSRRLISLSAGLAKTSPGFVVVAAGCLAA